MKHKWELKNGTDYNSRELRKIFNWCFKHEGAIVTRIVIVNYGRGNWGYTGSCASLYNGWIQIHLPRSHVEIKTLAKVFIHEMGHNLGLRHKEMVSQWNIVLESFPREWKDKHLYPIIKEKKKLTTNELQRERYQHAQKMLTKAQTRFKRAKTIERKWKEKVKYYESVFVERKAALKITNKNTSKEN